MLKILKEIIKQKFNFLKYIYYPKFDLNIKYFYFNINFKIVILIYNYIDFFLCRIIYYFVYFVYFFVFFVGYTLSFFIIYFNQKFKLVNLLKFLGIKFNIFYSNLKFFLLTYKEDVLFLIFLLNLFLNSIIYNLKMLIFFFSLVIKIYFLYFIFCITIYLEIYYLPYLKLIKLIQSIELVEKIKICYKIICVILKSIWSFICTLFWMYIQYEVNKRKVGTVDDFIYNVTEILKFIKKIFINFYLIVINLIIDLYITKKGLKFFLRNTKKQMRYPLWVFKKNFQLIFMKILNNLKFKIKFMNVYTYLKLDLNRKKISSLVLFILIFFLILKFFKISLIYIIFSSKVLDMCLLYLKSYKKYYISFCLKFNLIFQKFYFRRYIYSTIFRVENRIKSKFKFKRHYFFEENRWYIKNRISRWFLRKRYIDRVKYRFAEKFRKKLYIHPQRKRLIYLFLKVLPVSVYTLIIDELFNYDALTHVVSILKDIT